MARKSMDGLTGPSTSSSLFVAGDSRANEQVGITSMQTLLMREHNRQATLDQPRQSRLDRRAGLSDGPQDHERRDERDHVQRISARRCSAASAMPAYTGYNASVNPSISNAFAAVAFRTGHSMLDDDIERVGANGLTVPQGNLPLRNAFFNPGVVYSLRHRSDAPRLHDARRAIGRSANRRRHSQLPLRSAGSRRHGPGRDRHPARPRPRPGRLQHDAARLRARQGDDVRPDHVRSGGASATAKPVRIGRQHRCLRRRAGRRSLARLQRRAAHQRHARRSVQSLAGRRSPVLYERLVALSGATVEHQQFLRSRT